MINNKVKLAIPFSTKLLEDNTSCSCLEMFASISKLSLFERNVSDDSLDFSVFFLSGLSVKVWNEINQFLLRYSCWISPGWNRVSQLIYSAVWLTFCRGLPLGWKWASRKSMILFLCSMVCFLSTLYLWPILFTLEWKTNSHLLFWHKNNLKRTGVSSISCGYHHLPLFRHFLHSLFFYLCIP